MNATKEYPKNAGYQVWLGQALALTGDRAGALAAYRKAAELVRADESVGKSRENYIYLIVKGLEGVGRAGSAAEGPLRRAVIQSRDRTGRCT